MTLRPRLLIIDDDDSQAATAELLADYGIDAQHVQPGDLTAQQVRDADLIIVDEFLEEWAERDAASASPGLNVRDGVALAAVLRAELENRGPSDHDDPRYSPTAIVLRTGHLARLAWGLPKAIWPIAVAGRYDLEWVLSKSDSSVRDIAEIAHASASLPKTWEPTHLDSQMRWLSLQDVAWAPEALSQIEQCRPPWSTLAATSSGRVWLAWFLQRILPFPTFLIDDARAASYLGLGASGLDLLLEGPISADLKKAQYTGQLSELSGRRWWRAGIHEIQSRLRASGNFSAGELVEQAHGGPLPKLDVATPVFTIDSDYNVAPQPIEVVDAVRLQPDEWPAYADDPWIAIADVDDEPDLRKLIVLDDRDDAD